MQPARRLVHTGEHSTPRGHLDAVLVAAGLCDHGHVVCKAVHGLLDGGFVVKGTPVLTLPHAASSVRSNSPVTVFAVVAVRFCHVPQVWNIPIAAPYGGCMRMRTRRASAGYGRPYGKHSRSPKRKSIKMRKPPYEMASQGGSFCTVLRAVLQFFEISDS